MMLECWINTKTRRYYKIAVYDDLLGDRILMRNWGSMDNKLGRVTYDLLLNADQEQKKLQAIRKKRKGNNYKLQII